MNITKIDLCNRISEKLNNRSIKEVKPIIENFLDEILTILSEGRRIEIRGFGAFSVKNRRARIGRNPRTGEIVNINGYKALYFKFSKEAQNIFEIKMSKKNV